LQPLLHHFLGAVVVKDPSNVEPRIAHRGLPPREVVGISREAIDEKALPAISLYRVEYERACNLHRYNLTLLDVFINQLPLR